MTEATRSFIPAAGHDWTLPLYDPFTKLLGADRLRDRLVEQASLRAGYRVLDVGCGTGTLATSIKRRHPAVEVTGVDPDPKALARSRRKVARAGLTLQFDQAFADALPYADASFDRVFSSFMFHHLGRDEQQKMLREAFRVLKPGGRLELLDFSGPDAGAHGFFARRLHSHHLLEGNTEQRVLSLIGDAGFADARSTGKGAFLFGNVAYFQATRAG